MVSRFAKANSWIIHIVQRLYAPWRREGDALGEWQTLILFSLFFSGVILGFIAYIPGILHLIKHQGWAAVALNNVVYAIGVFVLLFPNRLSYAWRALLAVVLVHAVGIGVLATIGPFSGGFVWLFTSAILGGLLLSVKGIVIALTANTLTLTLLGTALYKGWLPWHEGGYNAIAPWVTASLNLLFLNAVTAVSAAIMMRGLAHAIEQQREVAVQLAKERKELLLVGSRLEKEIVIRRDAEEKYRNLAEHANDGIAVIQGNRLVYVNPRLAVMLGYTEEEMRDRFFTDFIEPTETDRLLKLYNRLEIENPTITPIQTALRHKEGHRIEVDLNGGRTSFQEARAVLVFLRDISHRIHMEAEHQRLDGMLQQTSSLLESILDAIPDVIGVQDADHRIVRYNAAGYRLLGKTPEEVLGRRCFEMIGHKLPCAQCATREVYQTLQPAQIEKYLPDLGVWLDVRSYPMLKEDGSLAWIIEHLRDITKEKQDEAQRQKMEEQLRQAQKLDSVGRLAGGVAHDFNNMLSVILGYTEMALNKTDPAGPLFQELTEIRKAAERSTALTRQLLGFARRQTVSPMVLDLNTNVDNILKMLRRLIGEQIALTWNPSANLWHVRIDPTQVDQILTNICVNARDAINGVGTITIETRNVILDHIYCNQHAGCIPGHYVMLAISDDGAGMDNATLQEIFEPFYTTKHATHGTGLGLSVVYGIVKQNEGFIYAYSEPGGGATFKVYLPRHAGSLSPIIPEQETDIGKGRGETLLLLEDEPALLNMGKEMLERLGYHVLAANKPSMALEMAKTHSGQIELLITDVVMPEMNGRELADRLHQTHPDLKTLFISGYTANVIAERGMLKADVHFLQKPFSMKDLGTKVRSMLETKQQGVKP